MKKPRLFSLSYYFYSISIDTGSIEIPRITRLVVMSERRPRERTSSFSDSQSKEELGEPGQETMENGFSMRKPHLPGLTGTERLDLLGQLRFSLGFQD